MPEQPPPGPVATTYRPGHPLDVAAILGPFRRGAGDPALRVEEGVWWLAAQTAHGPVAAALEPRPARGEVVATAWGSGAGWFIDGVPDLLGAGDTSEGFTPVHEVVRAAARARPGWRVPRSRMVMHALVPAAIEQKVTGKQAFAGYRDLMRRYGRPAPGPAGARGLVVAPSPAELRGVPSWAWLRAGIDQARSRTVLRAAAVAGRLEGLTELPSEQARERMRTIPGVGRWTAAEVAQRALGDADAVSFGDYHVAANIGWALTGTPVDDDGLAELLTPYAGHRFRVQRLLELSGVRRPRRGPRMSLPTHLPRRW